MMGFAWVSYAALVLSGGLVVLWVNRRGAPPDVSISLLTRAYIVLLLFAMLAAADYGNNLAILVPYLFPAGLCAAFVADTNAVLFTPLGYLFYGVLLVVMIKARARRRFCCWLAVFIAGLCLNISGCHEMNGNRHPSDARMIAQFHRHPEGFSKQSRNLASNLGMFGRGSSKFIAWHDQTPLDNGDSSVLVDGDLDDYAEQRRKKVMQGHENGIGVPRNQFVAYRRIEGNWYLVYENE